MASNNITIADNMDFAMKVLVVGNGCVGKSSMIRRLCKGEFNANYKKTIGVDYSETEIDVPGLPNKLRLMLWDTAGQEEFDPVTRTYYENAHAVVFAFSTTDRASFETIRAWRRKVNEVCDDICMVLVQNKIDLAAEAVVSDQEAEDLARELRLKFYRVSVKEYFNVLQVFQHLAKMYFKRQREKVKDIAANTKDPNLIKKSFGIAPYTKSNNFTAEKEKTPLNDSAATLPTESLSNMDYSGLEFMGMMGPQRDIKKGDGCVLQ
ncbi:Ras- protein Rab-23 [Chytridiales sp. JEL 0842]|nr:Ras- protein Rab-23 [Chytridiales sp. JEL 0842]